MLQPWLEAFPSVAKPFTEEVDHVLQTPLTRIIEHGTNDELTETPNAQPAIMATSILLLRILEKEFNFNTKERVDFMLGHSLGEFAALVAGGYLGWTDALRMVRRRAEAMATASDHARKEGGPVGMVALICEPGRLDSMIDAIHDFTGYGSHGSKSDSAEHVAPVDQVSIANINSKNQVVVSGNLARIKTLLTNLREFGGHDPRAVQLKSASPFHSPLMEPATKVMKRLVAKEGMVRFPGDIPCVSNVTGNLFKSAEDVRELLSRGCVDTVLWWESIKFLDQEQKVRRWVGIGPGRVGRNLVGKEVGMKGQVKGGGVWGISTPKEMEELIKGLDETDLAPEEDS